MTQNPFHIDLKALISVSMERLRQDQKFGQQDRSPADWLVILMEEVGEFSKAYLDHRFGGKDPREIRNELVQVAAAAMAMIECCDRNKWDRGVA